jgi:ppGpp synthetase/RelA/SpoT-type nucleotidyltranferase
MHYIELSIDRQRRANWMELDKKQSRREFDRLGDRLRTAEMTDEDRILLDRFRDSFAEPYETVLDMVRRELRELGSKSALTGRLAKTPRSIIEKLRRESSGPSHLKLTRIQDIAGCRVVVPDCDAQDRLVALIKSSGFTKIRVIDRRLTPSHGYRAVHVVVESGGKPVEIQIRTWLQDFWANLSEKLSDRFDSRIKYGGGDTLVQEYLLAWSELLAATERSNRTVAAMGYKKNRDALENLLHDVLEFWDGWDFSRKDVANLTRPNLREELQDGILGAKKLLEAIKASEGRRS